MIEAAGLLCYRRVNEEVEVFLTHPGGPFWAKKDEWSIPKGELETGEDHATAARREFMEETGYEPALEHLIDLGQAPTRSGKVNRIWAVETDLDLVDFHCDSMVDMEWPPRSGKRISFPENDKAGWFSLETAQRRIFHSQVVFLERLAAALDIPLPEVTDRRAPTLF